MQQPPHIDGPIWLQILLSVIFGVVALGVAYSGYFKKGEKAVQAANEPASAAIMAATIADGFAIRSLSDACVRLEASVVNLTRTIDEHTHHERNSIEIEREVCARLRELREVQERLVEIAERQHRGS